MGSARSPSRSDLLTKQVTTIATTKTKLLTADDLMTLSGQGIRAELIRGLLHMTAFGVPRYDAPRLNMERKLGDFVEDQQVGTLLKAAGIWLEGQPDTVRKADIAYISNANMQIATLNYGYPESVPDLLVELVGPTDRLPFVRKNAEMWREHGVPLVWVAYLGGHTVDVYRADGTTSTITETDTLDGGDVLPGFVCPVRDIFSV